MVATAVVTYATLEAVEHLLGGGVAIGIGFAMLCVAGALVVRK